MKTETQIIEIMNAHRRTIYRLNKNFISIPRGIDNDIADSILSEIHELQCELAVYRDVLEDDGKKYTLTTHPICKWISVKDSLPNIDNYGSYLVYIKFVGIKKVYYCAGLFLKGLGDALDVFENKELGVKPLIDIKRPYKNVTHWMPLPEPPENENE